MEWVAVTMGKKLLIYFGWIEETLSHMVVKEKLKLGEVLVRSGAITQEQLENALQIQKQYRLQLGRVLVETKLITEEQLVATLSEQFGIPRVDFGRIKIRPEALQKVKEKLARKHNLIPVAINNGKLIVAMTHPLNLFAVDEVTIQAGMEIESRVASASEIERAIQDHYGVAASIEAAVQSLGGVDQKRGQAGGVSRTYQIPDNVEAPVARLVEMIIKQALEDNASDIHIEPGEEALQIRYRIDGVLFGASSPPKSIESALISRIKVMANMDIAETRAPQDGGFSMKFGTRDIELRVSTCPTIWGENVVLRILDRSKLFLQLPDLGLLGDSLKKFDSLLKTPYGVILVTGPTGSGKTTTLYAALSKLNSSEKNIKTIEDPVEYRLPGIRQTQVNPKANITFATGLRSLMRQDPDIIMVGEIRDQETAEIAIQSALTGHLVLSTLHTNDTAGALTRLADLGIEPFLMTSSVIGILAQRLVRHICKECKVEVPTTDEDIAALFPNGYTGKPLVLFEGKGCRACKRSGYSGRIGIFEVLMITDAIRKLILEKAAPMVIRDEAIKTQGLNSLRNDGFSKVVQGLTTVAELNRVTFAEDQNF